jgi:hypothetical protein
MFNPLIEEEYLTFLDEMKVSITKELYLSFIYQVAESKYKYLNFQVPEDFIESVIYCLDFLYKREAFVVGTYSFVIPHKSYKTIGGELNISLERVRQIYFKGIRKIRRSETCMFVLINGLSKYNALIDTKIKDANDHKNLLDILKDISIETLFGYDIPHKDDTKIVTRSYNACKRAGMNNVYDLLYYSSFHIRNIGLQSIIYMSHKVDELMQNNIGMSLNEFETLMKPTFNQNNSFIYVLLKQEYYDYCSTLRN